MKINYPDFIKNARKSSPQVYFDYFYRLLSYPLSYFFYILGITPNQISFAQTILYLIAGWLVFWGSPVLGLMIFIISYLLDFCDGNVARVLMAKKGIPKITLGKGILLENLNTNIGLLAMYFSLGGYFFSIYNKEVFYVFAFLAFGLSMVARYSRFHDSHVFSEYYKQKGSGQSAQKQFESSWLAKIKFSVSKAFFSANFYYIIYLSFFIFLIDYAGLAFLIYAGLDFSLSLVKIARIFLKKEIR